MPAASSATRAALLDHPLLREGRLWQAGSLGRCESPTLSSGFPALDAELPGGGWPCQSLCEILQPAGQHAEWRLLAPGLRRLFAGSPGGAQRGAAPVLLIAPPFVPHGPGLQDLGLDASQWVWIQPQPAPDDAGADRPAPRPQALRHGQPPGLQDPEPQGGDHRRRDQARAPSVHPRQDRTRLQALHQALWVTEQAIKSQAAGAVLAWLEGARPEQIRRLQAAALNSPAPIFLMQPDSAAAQSSAAPLRLRLSQPAPARGLPPGLLEVQLIKRRGPAMVQPLQLYSLPPRLQHSLPTRLRQGAAPRPSPAPATQDARLAESVGLASAQAQPVAQGAGA